MLTHTNTCTPKRIPYHTLTHIHYFATKRAHHNATHKNAATERAPLRHPHFTHPKTHHTRGKQKDTLPEMNVNFGWAGAHRMLANKIHNTNNTTKKKQIPPLSRVPPANSSSAKHKAMCGFTGLKLCLGGSVAGGGKCCVADDTK